MSRRIHNVPLMRPNSWDTVAWAELSTQMCVTDAGSSSLPRSATKAACTDTAGLPAGAPLDDAGAAAHTAALDRGDWPGAGGRSQVAQPPLGPPSLHPGEPAAEEEGDGEPAQPGQ